MKPSKGMFTVVGLVLMVAALVLWVRGEPLRPRPAISKRIAPTAEPAAGSTLTPTAKGAIVQTNLSRSSAPLLAPDTRNGELERERILWASWLATPIIFYGRVVDETGNPIAAAQVKVSFADHMWEGQTKFTETTDQNGLFHASGHGLSIIVMASKSGYYHIKQSDGVFAYVKEAGTLETHTDPGDPAVFVMRKVGRTEPLAHFEHDYSVRRDGTPVPVDLSTGKIGKSGQCILVEAWIGDTDTSRNNTDTYEWHSRISVPGGGLVQRSDGFTFQAPETGYQEADEIEMPVKGATPWRSQVAKKYFVKCGNGNYARIEVTITAVRAQFFTVSSFLNASGSRNLEAGTPQPGTSP